MAAFEKQISPEVDAQIILECLEEGAKQSAVAEAHGVSPSYVSKLMKQAKRRQPTEAARNLFVHLQNRDGTTFARHDCISHASIVAGIGYGIKGEEEHIYRFRIGVGSDVIEGVHRVQRGDEVVFPGQAGAMDALANILAIPVEEW